VEFLTVLVRRYGNAKARTYYYGLQKDADLLPGLHHALYCITHSALIKYVVMQIKDGADRASCVFLVWQIQVAACGTWNISSVI
jgi:hypothetical protein